MSFNNNDSREKRVKIFENTMKLCKENPSLAEAIEVSISSTKLYSEPADISSIQLDNNAKVYVTAERSLECATRIHKENPNMKICVHNFASATNPGGGVTKGSSAQEEAICRCSTLYPCINTQVLFRDFYKMHKSRQDLRYTDTCIFTPNIKVIKSDTDFPERLPENNWFSVDVITCAAPNLRSKPYNPMNPGSAKPINISDNELMEIHKQRARCILSVAVENRGDVVILGAFGCGAFCNNPSIVAKAYNEVIAEFKGCFRQICFAVYCSPKDTTNYNMFKTILK